MDKPELIQHGHQFIQEVRDWLYALVSTDDSISVAELDTNIFWLKCRAKAPILLLLKPLPLPNFYDEKPFSKYQEITRTIILWEDVWHTKKDLIQSRLRAFLGMSQRIPGRVTNVRKIDRLTTLHFLEENHLQAPVLSKYKYGLFLPFRYFQVLKDHSLIPKTEKADELLVAVATFAHPRTFTYNHLPHRSFEMVRFANLKNTTVVGGLDKLLKHFNKEHQPDDIMTYVDLEWSTGAGYLKLGFEPQEDTQPLEFWVDPVSFERYYLHRLPIGVSEEVAMKMGFVKIRNAGSRKFVKKTKISL